MAKTKRINIIELQYSTGMSRSEIKKIKLKKMSFFFFFFAIFKKLVGRVGKTKNKKTLASV